jgi:hypothetical protein
VEWDRCNRALERGTIVKGGSRVALAVAAGYFLGRTRKMRLALTLAAAGATGRVANGPGGLVKQAGSLLGSNPELKALTGQVRGRLTDVGKAAAVSAASGRISALTDRLEERTDALRRPQSSDEAPETDEAEPDEAYEEEDELLEDEDQDDERDDEERPAEETRTRPTRSRARGAAGRSPVRRTARR